MGGLFYLALYLGGNPDYRSYGGWGAFFYTVIVGSVIGAGTAIAAACGGALAIWIWDRRLERSAGSRKVAGSVGAAIGAVALWLCFGVANALVNSAGWSWFGLTGIFVAVAAPIAAVLASVLIARADKKAELKAGAAIRVSE